MNSIQRRYLRLAIQPIPQRLAFDGGNSSPLYAGARDLWWRLSRSSRWWSKITEQISAGSTSRQMTHSSTLILVFVGNKKLAKWCNACNYDSYIRFSLDDFLFGCVPQKNRIKDMEASKMRGGEGAYTLSSQYYSRHTAKNNLVLHWLR